MSWESRYLTAAVGIGVLLVAFVPAAHTAENGVVLTPSGLVTSSKLEYRYYCASCHGMSGKGDGPVAAALTKKPPDLTVLAKDNGGKFPTERVVAAVEGTKAITAHGTREMPVWGREFLLPPTSRVGYGAPRLASAKRRIDLVVKYIESIQEK